MRRAAIVAASLAMLAATPATAQPVATNDPVPVRTIAKGDGAASSLTRQSGLVIRGERRWRRVWRKLTAAIEPGPRRPKVDFSKRMLLVSLQGRQTSGGHGTTITGVEDAGDRLLVAVDDVEPGPSCFTTGVLTSPYHVVRVRRGGERVSFRRHPVERDC
jgi:PrcB C-terminal